MKGGNKAYQLHTLYSKLKKLGGNLSDFILERGLVFVHLDPD